MKSYCVKQKKQTNCVPGGEHYVVTKNGRNAMKCKCAECGITKFVSLKALVEAVKKEVKDSY